MRAPGQAPSENAVFAFTCFFLHSSLRSAASSRSAPAESTVGEGRKRFLQDIGTKDVTLTRAGLCCFTREDPWGRGLGWYEADYKQQNRA